jgi:tetratricopeptide (TPR) repeat protein
MQKHVDKLSPEQKYEVDIRQAKYLLDNGQYSEARELLVKILSRTGLRPDQQIDTFIQLANVEIRLGKFQNGIKFFKEAVQISKEHGLKEWLAKAETGLGWAYRLTADLKKAGEHYAVALDLAIEIRSKHQQALLYNNLGFVYAYYAHIPGNREKALWFCNQSLSIWEDLDYKRAKGQSYSTLGCITFMAGQFDEALSYFQKALDIFEPAHDREWLSTVYSWRGAVHMSRDNFELAERGLLQSLEMKIRKDRPINLSRLGLIYVLQNKLDKAQEAVDECRELALALPDIQYQLISLRDMARLACCKGEYERLEEFERLLDDYLGKWEAQDIRTLGMLYLNLGNLALGKSDWAKAVEYFKLGLQILAPLGRYGGDTPQVYIERLEKVMVADLHLPPQKIRDIGAKLLSFWQEKGLSVTHPDVRILLSRWIKWEGV